MRNRKDPVERSAGFGTQQIDLFVGEQALAGLIDHSEPHQARAHVGEVNLAVTALATDHAGFEGITLAPGEAAHTHRAAPFGNLDVFGLQVLGGKDGGFTE